MATWRAENSMLTLQGVEILNKLKAGIGGITVTRVVAGSGRVSESQLYLQTSISGTQKSMNISSKVTDETGSEISVFISNEKFTESFEINQLGIFVTHPDYPGEVLYHISQCDEEDFDTIPPASETPVTQGYSIYLEHGNSNAITLVVDPQGFVTKDEFENLVNQFGDSNHLKESKTFYVETTGNDVTGDGSQIAPFATIQKAIDSIPPNMSGHSVTIHVGIGNFSSFILQNKHNGTINIRKRANLSSSDITMITGNSLVDKCSALIIFNDLKFVTTTIDSALRVSFSHEIGIYYCTFNGNNKSAEGVKILSGGVSCGISYCVFEDCSYCVTTNHNSGNGGLCTVGIYTCTGTNNNYGVYNNFATFGLYGTTKETLGVTELIRTTVTSGPIYINGQVYPTPVAPAELVEE